MSIQYVSKTSFLRIGFEPVTYGLHFNLHSPPLYQLSYRRMIVPPEKRQASTDVIGDRHV